MVKKKVNTIDVMIKETADKSRNVANKALGKDTNKYAPHPKPNPSDAFIILSAVFVVILVFGLLAIIPEPFSRMLEIMIVAVAAYYLFKNYREGKI